MDCPPPDLPAPRPQRRLIEPAAAAASLAGWRALPERPAIARDYLFADFAQAFAFMTRAAACAERLDHHPEWRNVYNRVEVVLTTHDVGGVTGFDLRLAQEMDEAAAALGAR